MKTSSLLFFANQKPKVLERTVLFFYCVFIEDFYSNLSFQRDDGLPSGIYLPTQSFISLNSSSASSTSAYRL